MSLDQPSSTPQASQGQSSTLVSRPKSTTTPTPIFRLLDLPAELRLHFYETCLLDPSSYIVPLPNLPPTRTHASKSLHPVILRLCKQIHKEALPVLYSSNTFLVRTFPLIRCVPECTLYFGRKNAKLIRRVVTVAQAGQASISLPEEEVWVRYERCGIKWKQLNFWGVRVTGEEEEVEELMLMWRVGEKAEEGNKGFVRVGEKEVRRLGVRSAWFGVKEEDGASAWVVMKGSKPRA